MKTNTINRREKAFTMVEMLVAIAVSIVVTLSLYAVFDQIQKAFRTTISQGDVMDGGRAAVELLSTELAELGAADLDGGMNLFSLAEPEVFTIGATGEDATRQMRVLREFFFLSHNDNQWQGIGYWVQGGTNGVGKLYRFAGPDTTFTTSQLRSESQITSMIKSFNSEERFQSELVLDGVVHLNIVPYDDNGIPYRNLGSQGIASEDIKVSEASNGPVSLFAFADDKLPAFIDLEIGVLEQSALDEMGNFPNADMRREYLERQTGKMHIFRERIPIRTANHEVQ